MHVTVSACSALAALLSPSHHASLLRSVPAGRRPDLGGQRPQLPEHPARRGRPRAEVVAPPHDDGEGRGTAAARPDGGGGDQVDRQLADRRELRQQQRGQVSVRPWIVIWFPDVLGTGCPNSQIKSVRSK